MSNKSTGPCLVVVTAPSGSGKTSIAHRLLAAFPTMRFSVSATTRPPRAGETDGKDYHFLTETDFRGRIESGALLEYEEVYPGRLYGTLWSEVERSDPESPVLLDIDVKGAVRVKERFAGKALTLFIRPPSVDELERRLRSRGTENEAELSPRLERARLELGYADRFDAVVVNDDLERAAAETIGLVMSFLAEDPFPETTGAPATDEE